MQAIKSLGVVAVMMLSGCATAPPEVTRADNTTPDWYPEYVVPSVPAPIITQIQEITELTDTQKQAFKDWSVAMGDESLTPAQKVDDFLHSSIWGFSFRGDTLTASHAMQENAGNCLSLALLTAALADEAGVDIRFQEDMSDPIYKQKGSTMLMAKHVRAILRDKEEALADKPNLTPKKIFVDYYSGKIHGAMVDRVALLAMYYRNKAAEALIEEKSDIALAYADKAWQLNKTAADSINMMAVTLGRAKQPEAAEQFYRFAIEHKYDNLMLRENYVAFLKRHDRDEQATEVAASLADASDDNPYNWIWRARQALKNNDLRMAKQLFYKAKDVAPYLVEPYHGLANVYVENGQYNNAADALDQAVEKAWDDEEKRHYQKKLLVLNSMIKQE